GGERRGPPRATGAARERPRARRGDAPAPAPRKSTAASPRRGADAPPPPARTCGPPSRWRAAPRCRAPRTPAAGRPARSRQPRTPSAERAPATADGPLQDRAHAPHDPPVARIAMEAVDDVIDDVE